MKPFFKIYLPNIKEGWNFPFVLFSIALKDLIKKIGYEIGYIKKLEELKSDEILFFFTGHLLQDKDFLSDLLTIKNKIVLYNSESLILHKPLGPFISTNKNIILNLDFYKENIKRLALSDTASYYCPPVFHETYLNNSIEFKRYNKEDYLYDILIYGSICDRRQKIIDELKHKGLSVNYTFNFETPEKLNDAIANSKVILIISFLEKHCPIDYFRLSYLLSNKALVIHEQTSLVDKEEKAEYCNKVIFCEYSNLVTKCLCILSKTEEELNNLAYEAFKEFKSLNRLEDRFPVEKLNQCLLK